MAEATRGKGKSRKQAGGNGAPFNFAVAADGAICLLTVTG